MTAPFVRLLRIAGLSCALGLLIALLTPWASPVGAQIAAPRTPPPTVPPPAITPLRLPGAAGLTPTPVPVIPPVDGAGVSPPATLPFALSTPRPSPTVESVFPLRPGTVEGALNATVPLIRYRFDALADQSVTLRMEPTSGTLDPVLTLLDPAGIQIARNDDAASGDRSAQLALTLTAGGAYTVVASSFGPAAGTFRLALIVTGDAPATSVGDPLAQPPPFAVPHTVIDDQTFTPGRFVPDNPAPAYYAIAGQQGDLLRVIVTAREGDSRPTVRLLDAASQPISRETGTRPDEAIAFATLPVTGWYLIETTALAGAGTYDVYASRLAARPLTVGERADGSLLPNAAGTSYLIDARIGDLITLSMFMTDRTGGGRPSITLYDLALREVATADGLRFATLRAVAPRSAPYIVQVNNTEVGTFGTYALRFARVPQDADDFAAQPARYNEDYAGIVTTEAPLVFYRFSGKTDELVTLTLAATDGDLDPYLLLLDADLNELAVNDDGFAAGGSGARIVQFRLPKDGDYLIVASRAGLAAGTTNGGYRLSITAGAIVLQNGALTASLTWAGAADLNLFVIDPAGQPVSWSAPAAASGGVLQIDSNTGCETLSDQPVEHVYWPQIVPGDYQVWVWMQNGCGLPADAITTFTLVLTAGETTFAPIVGDLATDQRYETSLRLTTDGIAALLDEGGVTRPTPQQQASEGGDPVIRYDETISGAITAERYALFYQFEGTAGDVITLTARRLTGDLDPTLTLLDAASQPLPGGFNDDVPSDALSDQGVASRDSVLTYTLPATGRYGVAVTRFGVRDGTTTGDFALSLSVADAPSVTAP